MSKSETFICECNQGQSCQVCDPVIEPVAKVIQRSAWGDAPAFIGNGKPHPPTGTLLVTTDQAEAYKDACVREALEEAAEIADAHNAFSTYDAIRALIPAEPIKQNLPPLHLLSIPELRELAMRDCSEYSDDDLAIAWELFDRLVEGDRIAEPTAPAQEPSDEELISWAGEEQFFLFCDQDEFLDIARALLARYGRKS